MRKQGLMEKRRKRGREPNTTLQPRTNDHSLYSLLHPALDLFLLQSFQSACLNGLPYCPHHTSFVNREPRVLAVGEQSCIATPQHFLLGRGLNVSARCSPPYPLCLQKSSREAVHLQSALCFVVRRREMSGKAKHPEFTTLFKRPGLPYGLPNMGF